MLGTGGKQARPSRGGLTAAELVGARRREPAAVTRLYTAYAPALFRFFLAAVGDRPTAEDLTGDVFKSAIEDLPRFHGPVEALGGWLFGIARHDLSDYRRRQARNRVQPLDDLLEEAALAGGAVDPEELALDRVEGDRVLAALQQLTSDSARSCCCAWSPTAPPPRWPGSSTSPPRRSRPCSTGAWPAWPGCSR